jgi:chromosome segregation ATPase
MSSLEKELVAVKVEAREAVQRAAKCGADAAYAEQERIDAKAELDALAAVRTSLQAELNSERTSRLLTEAARQQLNERVRDLQSRITATECKATEADDRARADRDALVRLQASKGDHIAELTTYRERCEDATKSLQQLESERRATEIEAARQVEALRHAHLALAESEKSLAAVQGRAEGAEGRLAELERTLAGVETFNTDTSSTVARLQGRIAELEAAAATRSTERDDLEARNEGLTTALEEARAEAMVQYEALQEIEAVKMSIEGQAATLRSEMDALKARSGPEWVRALSIFMVAY